MIFSSKAEYGVRLMVELGRQTPDQPIALKAIAEAEQLPLAYLEHVVARLKSAGLVESRRGAHGGYRLARPAEEITMDEVVQALEGSIAPMECFVDAPRPSACCARTAEADSGQHCATKLLWMRVQGGIVRALQTTTLAELVEFSRREPRRRSRRSSRAPAPRAPLPPPPCRRARPSLPRTLQETMAELEIRNLHVRAGDKEILKGLDLAVGKGEIHALMGPNGSGKSTLANVDHGPPELRGHRGPDPLQGRGHHRGRPPTSAPAWASSWPSSTPSSVPGVTVTKYLRTVMNAHRESRGEEPISLKEFRKTVEAAMELTEVPREFSSRYLNEGFSGGEKKRMEILQLALQKPDMAILDETDSGLDIDALRVVSNGVNSVAGDHMGVLIITHYQRILHLVQPSHVHVMYQGRIVKEGGPELVTVLEEKGYGWISDEVEAASAA